jgi:hypothetical protein
VILHPGILSLITGSVIVTSMILYASVLGIRILRRWDINSSAQEQLSLERKTYLVSTIMNYILGFEILSAFLFIYTTDEIHELFIGAMCATGSLNANPVGWKVLYIKIADFFLSALWIAFNTIDQKAEDYPLTRTKYKILLLISPVIVIDAYLTVRYFTGLEPSVITSCCGALFSEGDGTIASSLSSIPVKAMMIIFYLTAGIYLINAILTLRYEKPLFRYSLSVLSLVLFLISISSIISFISLYFYQIPTHHCPFDLLQKEYNYIGYPLYFTLFCGVFFGLITGVFELFSNRGSLAEIIRDAQRRWTLTSIVLILIFTILASWPVLFSDFTMREYF